jgi:RNA polymerase sigma-70 factor, ECF subfamily
MIHLSVRLFRPAANAESDLETRQLFCEMSRGLTHAENRLIWRQAVSPLNVGDRRMGTGESSKITALLHHLAAGDHAAVDQLFAAVYQELREMAAQFFRREPKGNTLQPTALVHEAYMNLVDQADVDWRGRTHFFAVAAQSMRRILVDHARRRHAAKRGGGRKRVPFDEYLAAGLQPNDDILAVDEALAKLAKLDPDLARLVELRFFGGLSVAEAAETLEISKRTAEREWTMARAWLERELSENDTA